MQRRSFLKTAAALFPSGGLEAFALGQSSASPAAEPAHLVADGQDRLGEMHSLGFSSILFKVLPSETNGGMFIIEHDHLTRGGPRLHLHPHQEEWFYVIEGEVLFQIGDTRKRLRTGDSILGPRMVPHTFSYSGEKPGRMLIAFTPAGRMEQYFRDAAIPNPPVQDEAFFSRYDIKLIGPSPFAA
jgi:mannose-6-phosphate isomerase-like protein (cupin superfamily)